MCDCVCDPLRHALVQILVNFAHLINTEKPAMPAEFATEGRCFLCSKKSDALFTPEVVAKIENCVRLYRLVNITQRTTLISGIPSLCLTFTPEYLKILDSIWNTSGNQFEESLKCLFQSQSSQIIQMEKDQFLNMQIMLDRPLLTTLAIRWVLKNIPNTSEVRHVKSNGRISIGMTEIQVQGDLGKLSLTQYRKLLIGSYINQVSKRVGYQIDEANFHKLPAKHVCKIYVVNEDEEDIKNILALRVGEVLTKETRRETIDSFFQRCLRASVDMELDTPEEGKLDISNAVLIQAAINFDILSQSPAVQLELDARSAVSKREHDAFLILYNYSRLVSILRRFATRVDEGQYPPILDIESVDFHRLNHETEISLIQMLLDWPRVLDNTLDFHRQEIGIGTHLKFIRELAYRFNAFYTLISVLVQPVAVHEFQLMFSRVHFIRAIRNVFHDFFDLMQVQFEENDAKL